MEEVVQQVLNAMLANNPIRVDYQKRYNEIIAEYNTDQDKVEIEKVFIHLINLSNDLSQEQQRYVRENLDNEEQLAIYDMLYSDKLSKDEILDRKCPAIDATISKKQALIKKLTAYKKSHIYEVVTGKKEV